jgi:hypothetical protein
MGDVQKVAEEGLRLDTSKDAGDFDGKPADKDKALADQAKGKSESTQPKGNQVQTMEEKGDYVLASRKTLEAIAIVRRLATENPEAVKGLVFDDTQQIGGKPQAVKDGEAGKDEAAEQAGDARKPEAFTPEAPKAEVPKPEEEKSMVAQVVASVLKIMASRGRAIRPRLPRKLRIRI